MVFAALCALAAGLCLPDGTGSGALSALLAETRAARDKGDQARAEALARQGLSCAPEDPVWTLTLSLVLADQKRGAEAVVLLDSPPAYRAPPAERLRALGYAWRQAGQRWPALTAYGEVVRLLPDDAEATAAIASLLDELRSGYGSAAIAGPTPERRASQAAMLVRWGADFRRNGLGLDVTDRALSLLAVELASAQASGDSTLVRRLRLDRMVALRDRGRMDEVMSEGTALETADTPLPAYARHAMADALLASRRPVQALAAYQMVLAAEPRNLEAQYGRVFALLESEQLAAARQAVDAIVNSQPPLATDSITGLQRQNPEHAYARLLQGQVLLWTNSVSSGWIVLDSLAASAPAGAAFRRGRAAAAFARGWPRIGSSEVAVSAQLEPDDPQSLLESASAAIALADLETADAYLVKAARRDADPVRLKALRAARRAAGGWILDLAVRPTFNDGGGANGSGRELGVTTRIAAPWYRGWRPELLIESNRARPPEGLATRDDVLGGLSYGDADGQLTLGVGMTRGTLELATIRVAAALTPDDRWTLGATAERRSSQSPLRGLLYGVVADRVGARVQYRRDEALSIAGQMDWLPFSDGNRRLAGSLAARMLLIALPRLTVTGTGLLHASTNSRPGGPYFSPSRDAGAAVGLEASHLTWRRYDNSFSQLFTLEAGPYWQNGLATGWNGVARYEHRWRFDPWAELRYAIGIDRRLYDGAPERGLLIQVALVRRL